MQFLARLMDHVLAERGQRATIIGATSGDTGGAAIEPSGAARALISLFFSRMAGCPRSSVGR
jgi:threonine synthase